MEVEPKKARSSEIEKSKWSPIITPRSIEPTLDMSNAEIAFSSPVAPEKEVLTQNGMSVVEEAVIKIQANVRGFLTRKHLKPTGQPQQQQEEHDESKKVEGMHITQSEPLPNNIVFSASVTDQG